MLGLKSQTRRWREINGSVHEDAGARAGKPNAHINSSRCPINEHMGGLFIGENKGLNLEVI
jgi:hypothetical protein